MYRWHILTGEYPPQPGGVSDYTRLVAWGLAAAGDEVTVWCPPCAGAAPADEGVAVRRLPDHFGPRSLFVLQRGLAAQPDHARVLLQYTPHAFGYKGMNLPLCLYLSRRRWPPLWIMFHEVAYPLERGQLLKHRLLGRVTRLMAGQLVRSAKRCFMSIPEWESCLRSITPFRCRVTCLPVPSNVPLEVRPDQAAAIRDRLTRGGAREVVGHFGTFGKPVADLLAAVLPPLLEGRADRRVLLVGRDGDRFAASLLDRHPQMRGSLEATGPLSAEQIAPHLAACDVLVQPYPDGASTRRTSLMAGLALGVPTVTTTGCLSEPLWHTSEIAALVPSGEAAGLAAAVEGLLADPVSRRQLGQRAARLYMERFSLVRTIAGLRDAEAAP